MRINAEQRGGTLYLNLSGEMDEHTAAAIRAEADAIAKSGIGRTQRAIFDLSGVSFMDSTGIGFLIGRYKSFSRYGIPVYVTNPTFGTDKILQMSGVYTLMPRI
jgi:stage II sporulation protein AA (anti-sigma F factor antagonist)